MIRMTDKEYKAYLKRNKGNKKKSSGKNSTTNKQKKPINNEYKCLQVNLQSEIKKTLEFKIPIEIDSNISLNLIYSGVHWKKRREKATDIHNLVKIQLKKQKVEKKICENPVVIEIIYNSNLDIDNHGYLAKLIIDGMKDYLIQEDNKKYVAALLQGFQEEPGITVRMHELAS